jgi:protein transport protein SEC24
MFVVPDLEQAFIPILYDHLLVDLVESRNVVESFLLKLPKIFLSNFETNSCLGKALKFAEKLLVIVINKSKTGGKIICLQHALPNFDEGALKMREDPQLYGTSKEASLLSPAISFYKNLAVDCTSLQISVDLFLFNPNYTDLSTLSKNHIIMCYIKI